MEIIEAQRIRSLPPYLFAAIDKKKREVAARGVDIISLGIGDPDRPTPPHIVEALKKAASDPANHNYPDYEGTPAFRQASAAHMKRRFGVDLDPDREVVSLIGSKEGVANMAVAFVDPGDIVLCPDPGYPVYSIGTSFNGGTPFPMPLAERNAFFPDLDRIPADVAARAKLMWLNYPNNPTSAAPTRAFFERAVAFARRHEIILCHDNAYSEIYFGEPPMSILQIEGAREVAIELHSLSKTYNMTGWRSAFAVGNAALVAGLGRVKTNVDSGIFKAVQQASVAAMTGDQGCVAELRAIYARRRQMVLEALAPTPLRPVPPQATFYVWTHNPPGYDSAGTVAKILDETGVVTTPGSGFGKAGEGYVRLSLTVPEDRLEQALERIGRVRF
jgi:LL-diaminopimelate aminotransferase